jgi:hypothetical protein
MAKTASIYVASLLAVLCFTPDAYGELMRGGATLSSVSSVIKISREGNGLDALVSGEILYIFTESGEPVSQIFVKDIFSDVIHSESLPDAVARQIRETRSILIFSNLREYGDYIKAFRNGTIESFKDFITRYPDSELREEAQRIFDGLVYRPYKIRGTSQAFDEFLNKYPGNYYSDNALKRRDDLRFIPVKAADRISRYRWFISTYPDNLHSGEARERIGAILSTYEDSNLEEVATYPLRHLGKKVKFSSTLHSALPVYVEGPGVGRKTALFKSPRTAADHLNFQVTEKDIVLWRLFASRENENLVKVIQESEKGDSILVYGIVFDILGGAPWIDVDDIEKY